MAQIGTKFSYRDYEKLPDEIWFEVINGVPLMSPSPTPYHQRVLLRLYEALASFVRSRNLGEVLVAPCDVVLSEHDIVQPDILFVSTPRLSIIGPKFIGGPPDLVVELSAKPSIRRDHVVKKNLYAKYGIPEYWLVDLHTKRMEVLALQGKGYQTITTSHRLNGFSLQPRDLF